MKYAAAVLAAVVGLAAAQDLSVIPTCAKKCIDDAVTSKTKCAITDIPCICKEIEPVTAAATSCVLAACGADVALNEVLPATAQLCAAAVPAGPSTGAQTTITSTGAATKTDLPLTIQTSTPAGAGSDTTLPTAGSSKADTTPAPSASKSAGASGSSSAAASTSTGGAASYGAVGSFGLMLLGAAAAL